MASKLKSLKELGAFDGEKYKSELPRDENLPKCKHKDVMIVKGNQLRCKCGAGWSGQNISVLYNALKNQ